MKTISLGLLWAAIGLAQCSSNVDSFEAQNLASTASYDVRVVKLEKLNYPTLDHWKVATLAACPDWQSADNARRFKNNLLVAVVSLQPRSMALFYGDSLKPLLDGQDARIKAKIMAPKFRDRDFVGGFGAAMLEIGRLYKATQSTSAATVVVNQPAAPAEPTDFNGLWLVLGIGVSLFGIVFAIRKYADWSDKRDEQENVSRGAQQKAQIAQQVATGLVAGLSDEDRDKLKDVISEYGELGMGVTDPKNDKLTANQYRAIEVRYDSVVERIQKVRYPLQKSSMLLRDLPSVIAARKYESTQIGNAVGYDHVYGSVLNNSPVIIPVPVVTDDTPAWEPRRSSPPPEPDPPSKSDDSSSSSWGSSSSYESSSSSYDSGSSSSYDSSSFSDSSGGSSSDW